MHSGANRGEVPWAGLFCGRTAELSQLSAAFERVQAGGGPETVVILGESGLGKTRLAQEFFARLSSQIDQAGDQGYWPDRLVRGGNNLAINPDPADCNPSKLAQMRFLWWGIRMLDRQGHNAGLGGISDSINFLRAHLEPFARARLLGTRMKQAAKGAAVDIAVEVANLFTFGLIGLGKLGVDHAREWKSILDERGGSSADSPAAQEEQQRESLIDVTLRDLGVLFEANDAKGMRLPAIILLDDAQWLGADENTLTFLERLLKRAEAENWPLLLIATHWEKEWHEAKAGRTSGTLAAVLSQSNGMRCDTIVLGREPDLERMISIGFPGLPSSQTQLLMNKAGGNPRLLDEVLRLLIRKKGFFENRDPAQALTQRGLDQVQSATFALHDLVADRMALAPENVRQAVGLASLQGERFLGRFIEMTAEAIALDTDSGGLEQAERPHSFVVNSTNAHSDFAQRVFWDVAREQLDDLIDADEALEALCETLIALAGNDAKFKRIEPELRELACQITMHVLETMGRELAKEERYCLADCYHESAGNAFDNREFLLGKEIAVRAVAAIRANTLSLADFSLGAISNLLFHLAHSGDVEARILFGEEAIRRREAIEEKSPVQLSNLAAAYGTHAKLLAERKGPEAARVWAEKETEIARKLAEEHDEPRFKRALIYALSNLLSIVEHLDGKDAAITIGEESLAIARSLKDLEPSPQHLSLYSLELASLATTILTLEGANAALPIAVEAVEAAREFEAAAQAQGQAILNAKQSVASRRQFLAGVYHSLDRNDDAVIESEAAIRTLDEICETRNEINGLVSRISAQTLIALYYNHADGNRVRARPAIERAVLLARSLYSQLGGALVKMKVADSVWLLGSLEALDGNTETGLALLREADEIYRTFFETTGEMHNLGQLLKVRQATADALKGDHQLAEALALLTETRNEYASIISAEDRRIHELMAKIEEWINANS